MTHTWIVPPRVLETIFALGLLITMAVPSALATETPTCSREIFTGGLRLFTREAVMVGRCLAQEAPGALADDADCPDRDRIRALELELGDDIVAVCTQSIPGTVTCATLAAGEGESLAGEAFPIPIDLPAASRRCRAAFGAAVLRAATVASKLVESCVVAALRDGDDPAQAAAACAAPGTRVHAALVRTANGARRKIIQSCAGRDHVADTSDDVDTAALGWGSSCPVSECAATLETVSGFADCDVS